MILNGCVKMCHKRLRIFIYLFCLVLVLGSVSCAVVDEEKQASEVQRNCSVPADQAGTLAGHWTKVPVPIALHTNDFSGQETQAIVAAATSWDNFYNSSRGFQIIDHGNGRSTSMGKPSDLCSQTIVGNTGFTAPVLVMKQAVWPYSNHEAVALTSFCTQGQSNGLPSITIAIMEVNYQDFFGQGKKTPDLQSIFLHEFGHLAGLDHSCEFSSRAGFPNCSGAPSEYTLASMFPVVTFDSNNNSVPRRDLNVNDQTRANCLY